MVCNSSQTVLCYQLGTAQGNLFLGLSRNLLLKAVSLERELSGTLIWVPQYVDMVAYDKLRKNHLNQIFFHTVTSLC